MNIEKKLENRSYVVAVDPSFTNMGVAIFKNKKVIAHSTGKFQDQIRWIKSKVPFKEAIFILENPNKDSQAFASMGMIMSAAERLLEDKITKKSFESTVAMALRKAQDVGKSKQSAQLLIDMLNDANIPFYDVAPSKRKKGFKWVKNPDPVSAKKTPKIKHLFMGINLRQLPMPTKLTADQIKFWTGGEFSERCSEHVRDAVTLFSGRSLSWLKNAIRVEHAKAQAKEGNKETKIQKLFQNA